MQRTSKSTLEFVGVLYPVILTTVFWLKHEGTKPKQIQDTTEWRGVNNARDKC